MSEAVAQRAEEQEPEIDLELANKIIDKFIDMPGNLMPVLQGAQDEYGYIPRVVADLIAERLNVYPSQIYGVLTFLCTVSSEAKRALYYSRMRRNCLSCSRGAAYCRNFL